MDKEVTFQKFNKEILGTSTYLPSAFLNPLKFQLTGHVSFLTKLLNV